MGTSLNEGWTEAEKNTFHDSGIYDTINLCMIISGIFRKYGLNKLLCTVTMIVRSRI